MLVQTVTKVNQSTNIPWVFTMVRLCEISSLPIAAKRLHDLTSFCKPSKHELETILDIVLQELEILDIGLVRFVNSYQHNMIRVLLRSWVKDAFIPVLGENCLSLVLDLMFCNHWRLHVWKVVSLALLSLIRPWIFLAKNVEEVKNVFSNEPTLIYLRDLRDSIKYLSTGGKYDTLPEATNVKRPRKESISGRVASNLKQSISETTKLELNESSVSSKVTNNPKATHTTIEKLEFDMNISQAIGKISARKLERIALIYI